MLINRVPIVFLHIYEVILVSDHKQMPSVFVSRLKYCKTIFQYSDNEALVNIAYYHLQKYDRLQFHNHFLTKNSIMETFEIFYRTGNKRFR